MKRFFSMLCFLSFILGAKAGEPTEDRVFATSIRVNSNTGKLYFNICLEGSRKYLAYGTDIILPSGLKVTRKSDGVTPNVTMIKSKTTDEVLLYPYYYDEDEDANVYYHTVSSSFPDNDAHHVRVGCLFSAENYFTKDSGTLFRVNIESEYAEGSWPIGAIKVYDAELNTIEQPYDAPVTETIVPVHTGETTLPLKVSTAAKWSTCILPFSAEIPEGVTAYTCSNHNEEYIYLEKAESFEAYTPYILYAENGYEGNLSGTVEATIPDNAKTGVVAGGLLNGAIVPQTATEGYVLQKQAEGVQFYAIADKDSFVIPAGKCWMKIPDGASRALSFKTDDEAAGINNVTIPVSSRSFDLSGRQQKTDKGVIIKNGKKTLSL